MEEEQEESQDESEEEEDVEDELEEIVDEDFDGKRLISVGLALILYLSSSVRTTPRLG